MPEWGWIVVSVFGGASAGVFGGALLVASHISQLEEQLARARRLLDTWEEN